MRILYIHQYFYTHREAGGSRSYSLAKYLIDKGHSVTMLTSNRQHPDWSVFERRIIDGIRVIYIKNKYSNKMGFVERIVSFIKFVFLSIFICFRLEKFDVVFATSTPLTVGITGYILKKVRKIPFVFEVRDLWPELAITLGILRNRFLIILSEWLEKKIYRESDRIIALSPGIKSGIVKTGYLASKITQVPNGCDIKLFQGWDSERGWLYPFREDDFVLFYGGAHGIANGLQYVIDIARTAKSRNQDKIKFVLIGDGMMKNILVKQKEEYELDNVLMMDPIPKVDLVNYIHQADMGMQLLANNPSFYYGTSPNKFFDYLAAGKPVLNNYPGWVSDLILEYNCGIVINPQSEDDFFKKIEPLIDDRNILLKMSVNAIKLAQKMFDRDLLAEKMLQVLQDVN